MRVTLTFRLNEGEGSDDISDVLTALHGTDYKYAIYEVDTQLRNIAKYSGKSTTSIEELRAELRELLAQVGIAWEF